jgi:predicted dehydrogenase
MLRKERLDVVQVACRPDRLPYWSQACLEHGVSVMQDKPLAMDLPTLERLYAAAKGHKVTVLPMHTHRGEPALAAIARSVQAGEIGEPTVGYSQKSYKWGDSRPDYFRSRTTYPGTAAFAGIHALDWLYWILGDVFTEAAGWETTAARPDYPGCACSGVYTLRMRNGGAITLSCDFLRPGAAPTHGDERLRLAGIRGVIEMRLVEGKPTIITADRAMRTLAETPVPDIFTAFVRGLRGQGPLPLSMRDAFRITEIALKTQQAADTGRVVSLTESAFEGD